MRPLNLRIQNFGPFREEQNINFREFHDFLLISGATGSGKTTIFDAIMYSLYGKLAGTREAKNAVSTFFNPSKDEEPFVEFIFSIKEKQFKIYRTLPYLRPAKRGTERMVEEPMKASLFKLGDGEWQPHTGNSTEIREYLEGLLHLSDEEFSRIVLLPQGEFQKFLVAETQEKRALLKKIFPTSRHEAVADYGRELRNSKKQEADLKANDLKRLLHDFDTDNFEESHKRAVAKKEEAVKGCAALRKEKELHAATGEAEMSLHRDFIHLDEIKESLKTLTSEGPAIASKEKALNRALDAETLVPLLEEYDRRMEEVKGTEGHREKINQEFLEAKALRDTALKGAEEIPRLEELLTKCREEEGAMKSLAPKLNELTEQQGKLKTGEQSLQRATDAMGFIEEKARALDEFLKSNESLEESLSSLMAEEGDLKEKLPLLRRRETLQQELARGTEELGKIEKELPEKERILAINEAQEQTLQAKRDGARAMILAETLKPGDPCPVCGSTEHPAPATGTGETFTEEEELRAATQNVRLTAQDLARLKERKKQIDAGIKSRREELENLNLGDNEDLEKNEDRLRELQKDIKNFEERRNRVKEKKEEIEALRKKWQEQNRIVTEEKEHVSAIRARVKALEEELGEGKDLRAAMEKNRQQIREYEEQIRTIKSREEESGKKLEGLESSLKEIDKTLTEQRKSLDESQRLMEERMKERSFETVEAVRSSLVDRDSRETIKDEIQSHRDREKSFLSQKELLETKLEGKERPDREGWEKISQDLATRYETLEEEQRIAERELELLLNKKSDYDRLTKEIKGLEEESQLLVTLADDLTGRNPKNINFQNFILGAYLREVTRYATERFRRMSGGRYSLMVNEEIIHGSKQTGLELDVFDSYSGTRRSVRSLSGGEKFLASISLSLGLADVIQNRAGDIDLKAIFIDEGFGSLDESSLDRALTILDEIRADRMVGIISHVTELKNRIPSQIRVEKSSEGSQIL